LFTVRSSIARSEYWKYFGAQLRVDVYDNAAKIGGRSGFYVPQAASAVTRVTRKLARAVRQPSKVAAWLGNRVRSIFEVPRLMSYEKAFDAVMSGAEVSIPIVSAFTVDHQKIARRPGALASSTAVKRHYRQWSAHEASANIINHYYYQNILRGYLEPGQVRTILEIGAGNGNFPSILHHDWAPVRVVLVDLPETLAISIPFLSSLFPNADLTMPHEIQERGIPQEFDFAFLTVDQLSLLLDDSVDLAINCHSFQEMTRQQICVYFELIQRVCRDGGFFFSANRLEKIPSGADAFLVDQPDPPNRMAEFPWNPHNQVLVYEISRLTRLVQLDGVAMRLERIHKMSA